MENSKMVLIKLKIIINLVIAGLLLISFPILINIVVGIVLEKIWTNIPNAFLGVLIFLAGILSCLGLYFSILIFIIKNIKKNIGKLKSNS